MPNIALSKYKSVDVYGSEIGYPAIFSAILHIGVFILVIYGLPHIIKDPYIKSDEMVMSVELFDPSEVIETTKSENKQKSEDNNDTPPPPAKPIYNNSDVVPDLLEPEQPNIEENQEDIVLEDPTFIKTPPKPNVKPKPPVKIRQSEPIQDKQKEEIKPKRTLTSLLKDLTPDENQDLQNNVNNNDLGSGKFSQEGDASRQMTDIDIIALNRGVQRCWNVNAGARYAENKIVKLRVLVNPDRSVREVIVLDKVRYNMDPSFRASADAARWALLDPKCSRLNLPLEKYDTWKSFIYVFDPSQML